MIGETISIARERTGYTQVELAKRLGMTKGQLWKIEKGTSKSPRALRDPNLRWEVMG